MNDFDFSQYNKINYGCGYEKLAGYLNVDIDVACNPDFLISPTGDLSALPKHQFIEVYAKDVLEHIPRAKSLEALLELASLLQTGGTLVVQTTSITAVAKKLADNPTFAAQYGWTICLFGNQAHAGDFHHTGFTDVSLTVYVAAAGFEVLDKQLTDEWMFRFECRKLESWDDLLFHSSSDQAFLEAAYQRLFFRPLDEIGLIHFGGRLNAGVTRRSVLRDIASSPERLYVTAAKLGL